MQNREPRIWLTQLTNLEAEPDQRKLRLISLGKLWALTELFHPWFATFEIDWDGALVKAIKELDRMKTQEDYWKIASEMMSALGDYQTYSFNATPLPSDSTYEPLPYPEPPELKKRFHQTRDGIAVFNLNGMKDEECIELTEFIISRLDALKKPKGIVFDIRTQEASFYGIDEVFNDELARHLSRKTLVMPTFRQRYHYGCLATAGTNPRNYGPGIISQAARKIEGGVNSFNCPVVFLTSFFSNTPLLAVALQTQSKGFIVCADRFAPGFYGQSTLRLILPDDVHASIRLTELVSFDGSLDFYPDITLESRNPRSASVLNRTLNLIRNNELRKAKRPKSSVAIHHQVNYTDFELPTREMRLVAAFRIWAAVEHLFPYKDLMDRNWDAVFETSIDEIEAATDPHEYYLATAKMIAQLDDSHAGVSCYTSHMLFGDWSTVIRCRYIEGKYVVSYIGNEDEAAKAGVKIGDVILSVDGEKIEDKIKRFKQYCAASTPQAFWNRIAWSLLSGTAGSTATLVLDEGDGVLKSARLKRREENNIFYDAPTREGDDIFRVIEAENLGYADLTRLEAGQVDEMFELFKNTRGIIFDMRGYPRNTGSPISSRLTEKMDVAAARSSISFMSKPHFPDDIVGQDPCWYGTTSTIPNSFDWKYKNKTVLLIDERAMSQSEQVGMFLKAANGTTFIGSPTTGANGTVTEFHIPGSMTVTFTGEKYFFPDGTQLQRVGLQPDVHAVPTIAGLRAGRDEVLETAIDWLREHS